MIQMNIYSAVMASSKMNKWTNGRTKKPSERSFSIRLVSRGGTDHFFRNWNSFFIDCVRCCSVPFLDLSHGECNRRCIGKQETKEVKTSLVNLNRFPPFDTRNGFLFHKFGFPQRKKEQKIERKKNEKTEKLWSSK